MEEADPVHVYKYRWIVLLTFCLYATVNLLQLLQYTIIANITTKYYDVDSILVDLTGLLFMICFVIFCIPTNYLIEKYNLKVTAIISSGLTTAGNLIKLLSVSRDRFYVVLIGQFLCALGHVFILCVPSKLANTWFGPNEVSTACALAILGTQVGVSAGSIFASNLVKNSDDMDSIGEDFWLLMIINASITTAVFVLILIFFRAKPKKPPSQSQANIVDMELPSLLKIFKAMVKNKNYLLILLAIGGSNGMYTCFGIIINTVYLHYFPGYEAQIGIIIAIAVIAGGCIGSLFFGYILDKYHHFKITSFFVIFASSITYVFVVLSMELDSQLATYFTIPMFGFFIASTLLVGIEFATEVMYPIPETATVSVLNSITYLFGVIYTLAGNGLLDAIDYIPTHIIVFVLLILSAVVVYFIKPDLQRRKANTQRTMVSGVPNNEEE